MDLLIRLHEAGPTSSRVLPPASQQLLQSQPVSAGNTRTTQAPSLQRRCQSDAVKCQPGSVDCHSDAAPHQPGGDHCQPGNSSSQPDVSEYQSDTVLCQPDGDKCQSGGSSSQPGSSPCSTQCSGGCISMSWRCAAALMTCVRAAPSAVATAAKRSRRTGRIRQVLWPPAVTSGRRLEALGNMRATRLVTHLHRLLEPDLNSQ